MATFPTLGKSKGVKDNVISILSHEWPLSAKKVYNIVRKDKNVSYQAVHKALRELLEDGVLVREDRGYKLNKTWIKDIEDFGKRIKSAYSNKEALSIEKILEKGGGSFRFDNLYKFYVTTVQILDALTLHIQKSNIIGLTHMNHLYWALASSEKEYKLLRDMFRKYKHIYILCRHDTYADKLTFEYYKTLSPNFSVKFNVDYTKGCDIFIGGDFIIQVFFHPRIMKLIDSAYKEIKDTSPEGLKKLYNILFDKKTEINVIINRNPRVAEQIRQKTLEYFKDDYETKEERNGSTKNLIFNTMFDVDKFLLEFIGENILQGNKKEKQTICINWEHFWIPLFLDKEIYSKAKNIGKLANIYSIARHDSVIDNWCCNFWRKVGVNAKSSTDISGFDFLVYGDIVIQIFYPKGIKMELDRIFSSTKRISDLDVDALFRNLFEKRTKIPVTITENSVLAEQLRQDILGCFNENE